MPKLVFLLKADMNLATDLNHCPNLCYTFDIYSS